MRVGFRTSIITLFVVIVLFVGLTMVYLSFSRISAMSQTAATTFVAKVAQLGADRINARFKTVHDGLKILSGIPAVKTAQLRNNVELHELMASILLSNPQLFNVYVGYEDGSFLEMDVIDRAGARFRTALEAPAHAVYRVLTISRTGTLRKPVVTMLSADLAPLSEVSGPANFDPRQRPWYRDAFADPDNVLTGPYVFFASGQLGYTLRMRLPEGNGVAAGDILLADAEALLIDQQLGHSGLAFLFDDNGRVIAHPQMGEFIGAGQSNAAGVPHLRDIGLPGLQEAIRAWREGGRGQQFFRDQNGREYLAAFERIATTGNANVRLAIVAPLDEFYAEIVSERQRLFVVTGLFVLATLPFVFAIGAFLSRSLCKLAQETDRIQRFELEDRPLLHSAIREIDDLGHSVHTMRTVIRNFSSFVPKRLVQQLVSSGASMQLGGTRREVTVLFTDIADFTGKIEKADPTDVMVFTSRYFAAMSETIMAWRGTVDKFIGDGLMAIWNAPVDDPDHVRNACAAVLACVRRSAALNQSFERDGWHAYQTRFGLHVGDAVTGNIGSSDRMNYTALGATINLAARLEVLNKSYGTRILVSEALKRRAEPAFVFRSVDCIKPKGFGGAVAIYELCGEQCQESAGEFAVAREWEDVYAALRTANGAARLAAFLGKYPEDGVAAYHATFQRQQQPLAKFA